MPQNTLLPAFVSRAGGWSVYNSKGKSQKALAIPERMLPGPVPICLSRMSQVLASPPITLKSVLSKIMEKKREVFFIKNKRTGIKLIPASVA